MGTRIYRGLMAVGVAVAGCDSPTGTPPLGVAHTVEVVTLAQQSAPVGTRVAFAPIVRVLDVNGDPVAGVDVDFVVTSGGGLIEGIVLPTSAAGRTGVWTWRLGPTPGPNTLEARVAGIQAPVVFSATARAVDSPFEVIVRYENAADFTAAQRAAIAAAAQRVRSTFTAVPEPVSWTDDPWMCRGVPIPAIDEVISNPIVYVYARSFADDPEFEEVADIAAGVGGTCIFRINPSLPFYRTAMIGRVIFDTADFDDLTLVGDWETIAAHEIVHALGFGGNWNASDLIGWPDMVAGRGGPDPRFIGPSATEQYLAVHGTPGGSGVPVENTGGEQQAAAHWRTSAFQPEMMWGGGTHPIFPLSRITVGAMADIGYEMDPARADPYTFLDEPPSSAVAAFRRATPMPAGSYRAVRAPTPSMP